MTTLNTWTFFGHYQNDELIINHAVLGEVEDVYPCDGWQFPEGLWCDYGTGATLEAAEAEVRRNAAADNGETVEDDDADDAVDDDAVGVA